MKELMVCYRKPFQSGSSDSFSRGIKKEDTYAGINTKVYEADMCKALSSNKAKENGMSVTHIKWGCWKNENTFKTFFIRDTVNSDNNIYFNYVTSLISKSIKAFDNKKYK